MMRNICILVVSVVLCITQSAVAEDKPASAPFPGIHSQWNGYDRYDFKSDSRSAIVVAPKQPADGKPWLWRAEFFGAFATVDQALLDKGWHVAYLNCQNTFGSPETMAHWAVFYKMLTEDHGFDKKPVLLGMSRGGLYVYNWAAAHPETVGMIYGDAPVCDAKSWPGGKGKGKGSAPDWKMFRDIYGFKTEQDAIDWKGNPIDELEPIAKAKIPIIHVVGDADNIVPVDENTAILKDRYEKLGGHLELIVKKGVGHHPHSLADPSPIVDYILQNRLTRKIQG